MMMENVYYKNLRKQQGFTQTQIAEYLGITQGQVAKLEKGTRNITPYKEKLDQIYLPLTQIRGTKHINLQKHAERVKIIKNIQYLAEITECLKK